VNDFDEAVARREQAVGADRERRRIRPLIAPHLRIVLGLVGPCHDEPFTDCPACHLKAIDAATRAPKRGKR